MKTEPKELKVNWRESAAKLLWICNWPGKYHGKAQPHHIKLRTDHQHDKETNDDLELLKSGHCRLPSLDMPYWFLERQTTVGCALQLQPGQTKDLLKASSLSARHSKIAWRGKMVFTTLRISILQALPYRAGEYKRPFYLPSFTKNEICFGQIIRSNRLTHPYELLELTKATQICISKCDHINTIV